MKRVYLLRHAKSSWKHPELPDHDRPLAGRGKSAAKAVEKLERPLAKVAAILEQAEAEILAFYAFPAEHWRKLRSTNPLERFNREIGRRTDVVGIFPDDRSLICLVSMLAIEANDEWLVTRFYMSRQSNYTTSWDLTDAGER